MDEDSIVVINRKNYRLESINSDYSGPFYREMELKEHRNGAYWDSKDDAPILCGECSGNQFKVSACSTNYESKAYCSYCGNKILLHSG